MLSVSSRALARLCRRYVSAAMLAGIVFSTNAEAGAPEVYRRAMNGDVAAMRQMGKMASNGSGGMKRDRSLAIKWFEKAADHGDAISMMYLGDLYKNSMPKRAIEYYKDAYEAGKTEARKRIMAFPFSEVKSTIEEWAMDGDKECLAYVLEGYTQGEHGIGKDLDRAKRFFREAEDEHPALANRILNNLSDKDKAELSDTYRRKIAEQEREEREREWALEREKAEQERKIAREREEAERAATEAAEKQARERKDRIRIAFDSGDVNQFNALLAEVGEVAKSDIQDWLKDAVKGNLLPAHLEMAKAQGIDLNLRTGYSNKTLLMLAADESREQSVKVLLEAKLDPNAEDDENRTALDYAIEEKCVPVAALLIKAGSNVNGKRTLKNAMGVAMEEGNFQFLKMVLEAGADPNATLPTGQPALVEVVGADRYTKHRLEVLSLMLKHGANPNVMRNDDSHISVLMLAAMEDKLEEAKVLMQHGAEVNYVDPAMGTTPLHAAVVGANVGIVKMLLGAGAKTDIQTIAEVAEIKPGSTPLHFAMVLADEGKRRAIAHALIEAGADVGIANMAGETAQMMAMAAKDYVLCQTLEKALEEQVMMANIIRYGSIAAGVLLLMFIMKAVKGKKPQTIILQPQVKAPKLKKKKVTLEAAAMPQQQQQVEGGFFIMMPDGTQDGPFNTTELRQRVNAGVCSPDSLAWREGMSEWLPVVELLARYNA